MAGRCVTECPFGFYMQPTSQRCKQAPEHLKLERFYFRLALRISVDEFEEDPSLVQQILRLSAQTLAVGPNDVRFHRWDSINDGLGIYYYLEAENPYLQRTSLEDMSSIDDWFASLPVPIDSVTVLSYTQLYPPPAPVRPEAFIKPWMWAAFFIVMFSCLIICPLYHLYFIRRFFEKCSLLVLL